MRIKFYSSYCLIACLLFFTIKSFSQSGTYGNSILTEKPNTPINDMIGGFIEIVPSEYNNLGNTTRYPLLIFIEGLNEFGNGDPTELQRLYGQNNGMLPDIVRDGLFANSYNVGGTTYKFIVIVPQIRRQVQIRPPAEQMASPVEVNDIINYALQNYRVDEDRVYLSGTSLGGGSTWNYPGENVAYGNRLAAIVPFSGASNLWDNHSRVTNIAASHLPVWTFVSSGDHPYDTLAQRYIDSLMTHPEHAADKFITVETSGHDSWFGPLNGNPVGSYPNIYSWMLGKSRSLPQPQFPLLSAGSDNTVNLANGSMVLNPDGVSFNGASAPLNGAITGVSGRSYTYRWRRVSGNGGEIGDSTALNTSVTNLKPGSYTYQLRATDDQGLTTVDNMNITVNAPPENKYHKVEAENFTALNPSGGTPLVEVNYFDEGPASGLGFLDPGRWMEYSLSLPTAGTYNLYYRYISQYGNPPIRITVDGTTYNRNLNSTNEWRTDMLQVNLGTNSTIRFESQGTTWNFNYFELALASPSEGSLPVKLVYFNSLCRDGLVSLQWKTAQEVNSDRFAVERSADGVHWSEIASVAAAGQSSGERSYSYQDRTGGSSNSLYRIVEYDYNGQTTLSSIVRGNCGQAKDAISLYPNPSSSSSTLSVSLEHASKLTLRVMDSKGALIEQRNLQLPSGNSSIPLNVSQYAKGIYTVQVYVSYNGEVKTLKLIRK